MQNTKKRTKARVAYKNHVPTLNDKIALYNESKMQRNKTEKHANRHKHYKLYKCMELCDTEGLLQEAQVLGYDLQSVVNMQNDSFLGVRKMFVNK